MNAIPRPELLRRSAASSSSVSLPAAFWSSTSSLSLRRSKGALALCLLTFGIAPSSYAQETAESSASLSASPPASSLTPLRLRLEGDSSSVNFEVLRAALETELARPVVSSTSPAASAAFPELVLTYRSAEKELAVSYLSNDQGTITRVVDAPEDADERQQLIVLLISSLTRHEAQQILPAQEASTAAHSEQGRSLGAGPPTQAETPTETSPAPPVEEPPAQFLPANFSLFYPIAVNYFAPDARTHFNLGLTYSRIGELHGLELGGVNWISRKMQGVEIAYAANIVTGPAQGVQLSGGFNHAQELRGLQITAGVNHVTSQIRGAQLGLVNWANTGEQEESQVQGAQIGLANWGEQVSGAQLGLLNISQELQGAAVGLLNLNLNRESLSSATQIGLLNINPATGPDEENPNYQGPQIGLLNIGGNVRGAQVGLLNLARDVEGVSVGLLSLSRTGSVHPLVWSSTNNWVNVGVKFANRYTYSTLYVSAHPTSQQTLLGYGLNIGVSIPTLPGLFVEPELGIGHSYDSDFLDSKDEGAPSAPDKIRRREQYHARVSLRYAFAPHLSVFLGGGVIAQLRYEERDRLTDDFIYSTRPEGFAGVQF